MQSFPSRPQSELARKYVPRGGAIFSFDIEGGLAVIMNRCIKVEHARYLGRMHWRGFNTRRITSVRAGLAVDRYCYCYC